jgi:hypothetical protein
METWGALVLLALIVSTGILWVRHETKVRDRIDRAFSVGRRQGYYEGWLAHANATPLQSMPPRLKEIEEAIGIQQGWGIDLYDYQDTDELVQSGSLGKVSWEEWQARKLKELNAKYLGSNQEASSGKN